MATYPIQTMTSGRLVRTRLEQAWRSKPVLVAFALAFVVTVFVAMLQSPKPFIGDSSGYWNLANTFTRQEHFSLLNFPAGERGYALPLVYYVLHAIVAGFSWSQSSVVKLLNVLVFVLIGTVLAPKLAEITWPDQRWNAVRRVALTVLLIIFWSGYLNFPLSDFSGLAVALLALIAIAHADSPAWMLVAGVAGGLTIDIRAAYVLLGPALIILFVWAWLDQRGARHASYGRRALCAGLLVAGFAAVSLPQSLSAHRHQGTWSFIPGTEVNVSHTYLTNGLDVQLYNTYIPTGKRIVSVDETGLRLLESQAGRRIDSQAQYISLAESHPIAMGAIFMRHIINGLDQRYSTVYIEHLHTWSLRLLRITGFLFVLLSLLRILWPTARHRLGTARWRYLVALSLCSSTAVLVPVETRYLLPVYLLSWMLVLTPGWPKLTRPDKVGVRGLLTAAMLVGISLVFVTVVWYITSEASNHIRFL
jgi:hypothetical protein